ncbi:hypothetical protein G7Y89_g9958 [Cudoniella acicularis]|uniref:Cytochrome P450 n=1 Tax=Cudoniella acicularis TaxID=354080 RepID=A0A8H4RFZ4_9HELO|nr:hypothetical protein G7Y89_g9958 [Cudoniella acicularis]
MLDYTSLALYSIPAVILGTKVLTYLISLYQTRRQIKSPSVPVVRVYTWRDDMVTWLLSPWLALFLERLPFQWGHWIRYTKRDFNWWSKGDLARQEVGDVYWNVGPGGAALWISDADVITQIIQRRNDFVKQTDDYRALDLYGPNVVSTEGAAWQRHRRITGPPFNEKNSSLVFDQTLTQGKAMLASFIHDADGSESIPGKEPVVEDLIHWTMTVTLNVISSAALNIKAVWPTKSVAAKDQKTKERPGDHGAGKTSNSKGLPFQESFDLVMNNVRILILFPDWLLRISPFELLRKSQKASENFRNYMYELIATQKAKVESGSDESDDDLSSGSGDLLSNIIKGSTGAKGASLTEEEMIGNIFIFVLAGHETTASTLQTGLILLACEPNFQVQVQKEIDEIWAGKKAGEDLTYGDYPKMRIIMALMLETLRLYPPAVMIPKVVTSPQTLTYENKTVILPPGSRVGIDVVSTQRNPKYWGPTRHEFIPTRWLMPSDYVPPPDSADESPPHSGLYHPPKNAFIAFNGGFRGCLGRKFAQVEFCTVIAVLLKDHTVELVDEGKGWEDTKKKALEGLDNRQSDVAMRLMGKVKVSWKEVQEKLRRVEMCQRLVISETLTSNPKKGHRPCRMRRRNAFTKVLGARGARASELSLRAEQGILVIALQIRILPTSANPPQQSAEPKALSKHAVREAARPQASTNARPRTEEAAAVLTSDAPARINVSLVPRLQPVMRFINYCAATVGTAVVTRTGAGGIITEVPSSSGGGGLSTGAKAGIGTGIAGGLLIAIGLMIWFIVIHRRNSKTSQAMSAPAVSQNGGGSSKPGGQKRPSQGRQPSDYFGPSAAAGPFTEDHISTATTPNTNRGGVPAVPETPGDIASPVEIDSRNHSEVPSPGNFEYLKTPVEHPIELP